MTRAQLEKRVKRILQKNARAGRSPHSLYELAQIHGLPRMYFTDVLKGRKTIPRVLTILENVATHSNGEAAA
jgi:hypothetical protein